MPSFMKHCLAAMLIRDLVSSLLLTVPCHTSAMMNIAQRASLDIMALRHSALMEEEMAL